MNGKELIRKLNNKLEELQISKDNFGDDNYSVKIKQDLVKEFGEYECVYDARDDNGDHDSWTKVWYFSSHDVYISLKGYYSSWDGVDYSYAEFKHVFSKERTVIYYEEE